MLILLAFDDLIVEDFVKVKLHTSAMLEGPPLSEEMQTEYSHDLAVLIVDTTLVGKQQVEDLEDPAQFDPELQWTVNLLVVEVAQDFTQGGSVVLAILEHSSDQRLFVL